MAASIFARIKLNMRKIFVVACALFCTGYVMAQDVTTTVAPSTPQETITRAGDHFMFQIAQNSWLNAPDSVSNGIKSFNRSANAYFMLNKPFKTDKRFSLGLGVGIGTSNIYFDKEEVNITGTSPLLQFARTDATNNYKKYKLATAYAEVPLELRFTSDAVKPKQGIKAAIGVKIGTLLNAKTKGKTLRTSTGSEINANTVKLASKSYFNTTRIAATARVGYGLFSLFGSYNLTPMFKDGVAADIKLLQFGLTISGL